MKRTHLVPILILGLMAILTGSMSAEEQDIATLPALNQNSSQSATPMDPPSCEADVADSSSSEAPPSEAPLVMVSSYSQCWDSYIQCSQDCNFYSEPTRSQCEAWCYQTHWCAQV